MITTTKRCARCKERLPRTEFRKAGNYWQGKCKTCEVEYVAEWKKNHPINVATSNAEYKRNWRKRIPADIKRAMNRKWALKRAYGMTPEGYKILFDAQGGVCAICGGINKSGHSLHVDHNHETGENRGLLCSQCNTALERLESVTEWHTKAVNYLAKYLTVRMDNPR